MVRMRGVTTMGFGWGSGETSDLVETPLNLVIYMHLRIFVYTSNTLIVSFEYMDWMLASGTLKNFRFLLRSYLFTDRVPVIKLTCSTFKSFLCITVMTSSIVLYHSLSPIPNTLYRCIRLYIKNQHGRVGFVPSEIPGDI